MKIHFHYIHFLQFLLPYFEYHHLIHFWFLLCHLIKRSRKEFEKDDKEETKNVSNDDIQNMAIKIEENECNGNGSSLHYDHSNHNHSKNKQISNDDSLINNNNTIFASMASNKHIRVHRRSRRRHYSINSSIINTNIDNKKKKETEFIVEAIRSQKIKDKEGTEFLVKWKNFPEQANTYEKLPALLGNSIFHEYIKKKSTMVN